MKKTYTIRLDPATHAKIKQMSVELKTTVSSLFENAAKVFYNLAMVIEDETATITPDEVMPEPVLEPITPAPIEAPEYIPEPEPVEVERPEPVTRDEIIDKVVADLPTIEDEPMPLPTEHEAPADSTYSNE